VCTHRGVEEAAAVVVALPALGQTLVCAAVRRTESALTELELRRHVGGLLPAHLRSGRIVLMDRLPRLTSGKLDLTMLRRHVEEAVGT
jgi:acyl-coenzyme A synthetase/AMP-(fatty) acid ligase